MQDTFSIFLSKIFSRWIILPSSSLYFWYNFYRVLQEETWFFVPTQLRNNAIQINALVCPIILLLPLERTIREEKSGVARWKRGREQNSGRYFPQIFRPSFENSRGFQKKSRDYFPSSFRKAVDLFLSLFCRHRFRHGVFDTRRQNSAGFVLEERLITVTPSCPRSFFSGKRAWKIQFSGHVLRCQLEARWDVWSCESYSAEILFVCLWFGRPVAKTVLRVK